MHRQKVDAPGLAGKCSGSNDGWTIPYDQGLLPPDMLPDLFQMGAFLKAGEPVSNKGSKIHPAGDILRHPLGDFPPDLVRSGWSFL